MKSEIYFSVFQDMKSTVLLNYTEGTYPYFDWLVNSIHSSDWLKIHDGRQFLYRNFAMHCNNH